MTKSILIVALAAATACGSDKVGELSTPAPVSPDPLAALQACAPSGWTASVFPPGSSDYALQDGQIRLIIPASVARRPQSTSTLTFITDWWTVRDHGTAEVQFTDGRKGTQYRSKGGPIRITTEFATAAGTWQLYAQGSEEHYDDVLRCVERRLAGGRGG